MHENIAGHRTEAPPYFFVTLLSATAILYAENITSLFLLCYKSAIHLYLYSLNSIILAIVVSPQSPENAVLHTTGKGITSLPRRKKPHTKQADGTVSAGWQKSSLAHIRRKGALPIRGKAQDTQRRSPL